MTILLYNVSIPIKMHVNQHSMSALMSYIITMIITSDDVPAGARVVGIYQYYI